ncbi:MAG: PA14 domain-containing protein [Sphingomonadaceae bacterium]
MASIPAVLVLLGIVVPRLLATDTKAAEPVNDYWVGEYFVSASAPWQDQRAGNRPKSKPLLVRNDPEIDFDWGKGSPGAGVPSEQFSVRWTRTVPFEQRVYRFHVRSDDGIRIYVDDELKMDRWYDNRGAEQTVDIPLSAGNHRLRVEYYENWGDAKVSLWWEEAPTASAATPETGSWGVPADGNPYREDATPASGPSSGSAIVANAASPGGDGNSQTRNLLANGGFELDSNGDGLPDGWSVSIPDSQFVAAEAPTGPQEGRKVAVFPPSTKSFLVTQEVEVRQNESYDFRGFVHIPSAGGWFRLTISVIPLNDRGQPLGSHEQAAFTQPTDGWVKVENRITMPTYTVRARVQIKVDVMRATAYLDGLSLERSTGS